MIVTNHNPLATIANLHRDKTILFDGQAVNSFGNRDVAGL
jgi:hypothetical protein